MTQNERDRLTALEVTQKQILDEVKELNASVEAMKLSNAKLGGIGLALTGVGAAIGWVLTQAKSFVGLFSGA